MKRIAVTFLAASTLFALPAEAQRQFGEVEEVVVVEVPVHVVHDGEPVRGLTADDFEIRDERRRETITGFEVVDLAQVETGERAESPPVVPLAGRRHFLFLFDLSFSNPTNVARSREAALDVLDDLHRSDLVAVATFSMAQGPQLVLGFTGDRRQIATAIDTLGLPQLVEQYTDPLRFVITDPFTGPPTDVSDDTVGGARVSDLAFQDHISDLAIGIRREEREVVQSQIMGMARSYHGLGRMLDNVEGRKQVVLFSEGVDTSVLTGTSDVGRTRAMNESAMTGQYWEIDSEERYGSTASLSFFQDMAESFLRSDATIQAVDISNLDRGVTAEARGSQDSLFMMADETGGELYTNYTDLGEAMEQLLDRTAVTYVLSFQPDDLEYDGEFRKLEVKLKGGPRGARVIHRPGYYAPKPYQQREPMERRLDAAEMILAGRDAGGIDTVVLATPFRMDAERAYVPVLIEVDGESLLAGAGEENLSLEIYGYAMSETGTVGDFFSQNLSLELDKVRPALRKNGLKFFGSLYLPPGRHTLRTLVREGTTGHHSTRMTSIEVPDFASGAESISPPLFIEAPGEWLTVRESGSDEQERGVAYPFTLEGGKVYVPAVKPVLAGASTLALVCHGLGDGTPDITATVLTANGQATEGGRLELLGREGTEGGADRLLARFDPGELARGEYRLVVEVVDPTDGSTMESSVAFVVGG